MSSYSSSEEVSLTGKCVDYRDEASFSISSSQISDADTYSVLDDENVIDQRKHDKAMGNHKKGTKVCYHRITFGKRRERHRHDILSKGSCIFIDGKESPTLIMHPGITYVFDVVQEGNSHDFVLTKSCMGHSQHMSCEPITGAPLPVSHGEYVYTAGSHTPASFYYQSSKDTWFGGHVNLHD